MAEPLRTALSELAASWYGAANALDNDESARGFGERKGLRRSANELHALLDRFPPEAEGEAGLDLGDGLKRQCEAGDPRRHCNGSCARMRAGFTRCPALAASPEEQDR